MNFFKNYLIIFFCFFLSTGVSAVDYRKKQGIRDTVLTPGLSIGSINSNKNVTSFFNTLNIRNRTTTSSYEDSSVTLV